MADRRASGTVVDQDLFIVMPLVIVVAAPPMFWRIEGTANVYV